MPWPVGLLYRGSLPLLQQHQVRMLMAMQAAVAPGHAQLHFEYRLGYNMLVEVHCPALFLKRNCPDIPGEFGQDQALLGGDYQVYECRAALHHLRTSSIAGALYAAAIRGLLGMR
jgi:hypothetical protein